VIDPLIVCVCGVYTYESNPDFCGWKIDTGTGKLGLSVFKVDTRNLGDFLLLFPPFFLVLCARRNEILIPQKTKI